MYLRSSNLWSKFLLAEGIEDIGLPTQIVDHIKGLAEIVPKGTPSSASDYARRHELSLEPIHSKVLTWMGQLLKKQPYLYLTSKNLTDLAAPITLLPDKEQEVLGYLKDTFVPFVRKSEYDGMSLDQIKKFRKQTHKFLKKELIDSGWVNNFLERFDSIVYTAYLNSAAPRMILSILTAASIFPDALKTEFAGTETLRSGATTAQAILATPAIVPDQIMHEFSNGMFWYDLGTDQCDFEAKEMSHCGATDNGSLISLRKKVNRRVTSLITAEIDDTTLAQAKGKANTAPRREFWPYIDWLIENEGITNVAEKGQHSTDGIGFAEFLRHLEDQHPDLNFGPQVDLEEMRIDFEARAYGAAESVETDIQTIDNIDFTMHDPGDGQVTARLAVEMSWPVKSSIEKDPGTKDYLGKLRNKIHSYDRDGFSSSGILNTYTPDEVVLELKASDYGTGHDVLYLDLEMIWDAYYDFDSAVAYTDPGDEESAAVSELGSFDERLVELKEIATEAVLDSGDESNSGYEETWELIQKELIKDNVYRDVAKEIDDDDERQDSPQLELPLQEHKLILNRWRKIITS
tara:strand:- start:2127 stop:3848 length:1722 start_codon:yes stop_codon:yes gene_type:complete